MNITVLKGNLTRDPDVREVEVNGRHTKVANFTLAVSRFFKRADGTRDKDTTFIPCEAWDTGADSISKVLKKGDPVLLHGALKNESWEQEDGQKRSRMKVRVSNFDKLFRSPKSNNNNEEAVVSAAASTGKDIPF